MIHVKWTFYANTFLSSLCYYNIIFMIFLPSFFLCVTLSYLVGISFQNTTDLRIIKWAICTACACIVFTTTITFHAFNIHTYLCAKAIFSVRLSVSLFILYNYWMLWARNGVFMYNYTFIPGSKWSTQVIGLRSIILNKENFTPFCQYVLICHWSFLNRSWSSEDQGQRLLNVQVMSRFNY